MWCPSHGMGDCKFVVDRRAFTKLPLSAHHRITFWWTDVTLRTISAWSGMNDAFHFSFHQLSPAMAPPMMNSLLLDIIDSLLLALLHRHLLECPLLRLLWFSTQHERMHVVNFTAHTHTAHPFACHLCDVLDLGGWRPKWKTYMLRERERVRRIRLFSILPRNT